MPEFVWELPAIRPAPTESVESTGDVIDHQEAAVNRLVAQFRKPKIIAFVRAMTAPFNALDQAFVDLITLSDLDNATGAMLNIIGKLVGQLTVDLDDVSFKSLVRARIKANKSSGTPDQILLIARLVFSDWAAEPTVVAAGTMAIWTTARGGASYELNILNMDLPQDLADLFIATFAAQITGAGILMQLIYTPEGDAEFDGYKEDFAFEDSWPATARFVSSGDPTQYIEMRAVADGAAGNGIVVQLLTGVNGPVPAWEDFDTGSNVRYRYNPALAATWEDLAAVIDDADSVELVENTATGVIGDLFQETTAGGVDGTAGTGFGDAVGYPQSNAVANLITSSWVDWGHIHLCDDPDTQDSALTGGLDFAELGTPGYHATGAFVSDYTDYAFACGNNVEFPGAFTLPTPTLQCDATDDFAFCAVIGQLGTVETLGQYPFFGNQIFGTKKQGVRILNGMLTFELSDGVNDASTAPLAVPDAPFTLMVVLDRTTNKARASVCEIGGTATASVEVDASALGSVISGQDTLIGVGDATVGSMHLAFWMAAFGNGKVTGLSANLPTALQQFTDYIVTAGGLRTVMEP